jgi:hypothetical protein
MRRAPKSRSPASLTAGRASYWFCWAAETDFKDSQHSLAVQLLGLAQVERVADFVARAAEPYRKSFGGPPPNWEIAAVEILSQALYRELPMRLTRRRRTTAQPSLAILSMALSNRGGRSQ